MPNLSLWVGAILHLVWLHCGSPPLLCTLASYLAGEHEQSKHTSDEEQKYGINHFKDYFPSIKIHNSLTVIVGQPLSF
jgi:hypothetical protein